MAEFWVGNLSFEITSEEKVDLSKWNQIIFGLNSSTSFEVNLEINKRVTYSSLNTTRFIDSSYSNLS